MEDGTYPIDYYLQLLSLYDPITHGNRCFTPYLAECQLWRTYLSSLKKSRRERAKAL